MPADTSKAKQELVKESVLLNSRNFIRMLEIQIEVVESGDIGAILAVSKRLDELHTSMAMNPSLAGQYAFLLAGVDPNDTATVISRASEMAELATEAHSRLNEMYEAKGIEDPGYLLAKAETIDRMERLSDN